MNRRELLRIGFEAGTGLLLGFAVAGCTERAPGAALTADGGFDMGPWVRIHPDNRCTVFFARIEMGQRIDNALARILAEELDLDWASLELQQAPQLPAVYGRQSTYASSSVRKHWPLLREAAAEARGLLEGVAATALGIDRSAVRMRDSHAFDPASGRQLPYIALAPLLVAARGGSAVAHKRPAHYRLLGKEAPAIGLIPVVTGARGYASDLAVPGLVRAVIARPPWIGGVLESCNPARALAVPGVIAVLRLEPRAAPLHLRGGVAVVASDSWSALQGRDALELSWQRPQAPADSAALRAQMHAQLQRRGEERVAARGDPDELLGAAPFVLSADYELPMLAHMTMEAMNCTAQVRAGSCRIWAPTQAPDRLAAEAARFLGIDATAVQIELQRFGGGFGRRVNMDFVFEALDVARRIDRPVQVLWTREDDIANDFFRPASMHRLSAALDGKGNPSAWRHRFTSTAIGAFMNPGKSADFGVGEANAAVNMPYRVPARSCEYTLARSPIPVGWWRGVDTTANLFAVESFIDELAALAGVDPVQYRLRLIDRWQQDWPRTDPAFPFEPARLRAVLARAAELANARAAGGAVGVACGLIHHSYAALAAVVDASPGTGWRIRSFSCVTDCGLVMDPDGARAQIEGGILHGLSAAVGERITVSGGAVQQSGFDSYPLLRIGDAPREMEIEFVASDAQPTGLGEIATPLVAPALANAIFRLGGQRLRSLPLRAGSSP